MLQALVPLVVLSALGAGVYLAVARQARPGAPAGEGDVREQVGRLFRFGLLLVALVFAAEGLVGLAVQALNAWRGVYRDPAELAQALSFTIVGLPALAGLVAWTRARLRAEPGEARSPAWAGYLGLALLIALIVTLASAQQTLFWAVRTGPFDPSAAASTVVWGAVLTGHWMLNRRRPLVGADGGPDRRTPVYLLAGSLVGLAYGGFGAGDLLRVAFRLAYDRAAGLASVPDGGAGALRRPAVMAGLGLAVWAWFWLAHARRSPRTERWYGYVLLGGVLSGLTTTLVAAGVLLHLGLQWLFGDPGRVTAATHFRAGPGAAAALLVGASAWIHHRRTLGLDTDAGPAAAAPLEAARPGVGGDGVGVPVGAVGVDVGGVRRGGPERVYDHLVAFVGLAVCAAAVTLVVAALAAVVVGAGAASVPVANRVVLAATFVLVGAPVWLIFWGRAQRLARVDQAELRSLPRRLHVLAALGVSAGVGLVSLVVLLNGFLGDVTAGRLSSGTLLHVRVPLGLVVSAAAVAAYYGTVHRRDRLAAPVPPPPVAGPAAAPPIGQRGVVLISDLTPADAAEVALAFGGPVLRFTVAGEHGPKPPPEAVEEAVARAAAVGGHRSLVTVRRGCIEVQGLTD